MGIHRRHRSRKFGGLAVGVVAVGVVALLLMTGCSGSETESRSTGKPSSTAGPRATLPDDISPTTNSPVVVTTAASCQNENATVVSTADELTAALRDALPGNIITLADGTYSGNFVASTAASPDQPIMLCGSRNAILDSGGPKEGYVLHLDGASGWQFIGFSVTNGQKGIMADGAVGNLIQDISVSHIGDEAIHLRGYSTDNVVRGNVIRDTGLRKAKFGEGVYIGSADSNWCTITNCEPDRSDRNLIEGNDIAQTSSESIDIKEGTTGGIVRDNTFSGLGMTGADSWVDVKGNDWLIENNTGTDSPEDGMQVHEILVDWGKGNTFSGNVLTVNADGYGINDTKLDSIITCDNVVSGAGLGLTKEPCV